MDLNQFSIETEQGALDQSMGLENSFVCQVSASQVGTLVAGQAVKIEDTAGAVLKILACDANSDNVFGFVVRDLKKASWVADEPIRIASDGVILYMTSGAAIAKGANVEIVASTKRVITNAGTNPIVGTSIDKATATSQLVRVYIKSFQTPQTTSPLVQTARVTATLAEVNAGKVIIPAVTGKQIQVTNYSARVAGTFTTTTSVDLRDTTGTIVAALPVAVLGASTTAVPLAAHLGAGFGAPLTVSEPLNVAKVGAAAAGGTSIVFTVSYVLI